MVLVAPTVRESVPPAGDAGISPATTGDDMVTSSTLELVRLVRGGFNYE